MAPNKAAGPNSGTDFIRAMVKDDMASGKYGGRVVTRFPPEPNGYLHLGHAKSICLNFGLAAEFGGRCHMRFDDTNPETEDVKYVESIQADVRWLGFDWGEHLYFASDYFEALYTYAEHLIENGRAYVDSLTLEEIRAGRGTVGEPGIPSPYRDRSVAENLDLFRRMRAGEFPDGAHVLRAKIDMAAPNMLMRDPVLYRIRHAHHYRAGDAWCIYPLYDFTHCLSDAIEDITHSLCTLEFKDNNELYEWVLDAADVAKPRTEQTEFAALSVDYTILSKRWFLRLVKEGHVDGWDDPRMPTIAGLRRRGVTPEAIRKFCDMIGVARVDSRVDIEKFEFAIRDDLNLRVPRVMAVLRPLKVVITNYPEGNTETLDAPLYPRDVPLEGSRPVPFTRELYIEADDFREDPPKGFFRLSPGGEVRLRYAYIIRCDEVVKNDAGEVVELRCTYDPATRGGTAPDGRKVKGTIHWVSAPASLPCEVRLYDRLFRVPDPTDVPEGEEFTYHLNPESRVVLTTARIEPSVADDEAGSRYQFERQGYFVSDIVDSSKAGLVYNRIVTLRDTWASRSDPDAARPPERKGSAAGSARTDDGGRPREYPDDVVAFSATHGVALEQAAVLVEEGTLSVLFAQGTEAGAGAGDMASWLVNELPRTCRSVAPDNLLFSGREIAALAALVAEGVVTRAAGRDVLAELVANGGDPAAIVDARGLGQLGGGAELAAVVEEILGTHAAKVNEYRAGRTGLLGFFVGQVMQATDRRADPEAVKEILAERLGGEL